jgi:membrane AbrB-like protein
MLGPLFTVGAVGIAGSGITAIPGGRQAGQLIIGCVLGQYFSPDVTRQILTHWWIIGAAGVSTLLFAWAGGLLLARISGIDRTTAFFASVPGGAAEMAILGERAGARFDRVALAHSLRILLVVSTVPLVLTWIGAVGSDAYEPLRQVVNVAGLALLLLVAASGGFLLMKVGIPNAWLLGPLVVSFCMAIGGCHLSAVPPLFVIAGQVLIGWALGSRFDPRIKSESHRFLLGVLASSALSMLLSILLALGIATLRGIPAMTMVLATAPGGISEMCVTAKILKLGVPLVTSFQVARLAILLILSLPLWRLMRKWSGDEGIGELAKKDITGCLP